MNNIKEILSKLYKDEKPVVIKNAFADVLDIQYFENIINFTPVTSARRFMPTYSTPVYNWPVPDWSSGTDHYPITLVKHLLDKGICYIRDCSRINKKVNNICYELEKISHRPVDAHIYFSYVNKEEKSFGIHKDDAHNFIIQVEGKTHWKIGTKKYENEQKNIKEFLLDDKISIDDILAPGDIIYVPAHVYHSAQSLTKRISISFPIPTDKELNNFEERDWIDWNA